MTSTGPAPDATFTWHYGIVAQWWAEFNVGGPDVQYYQSLVTQYGQPALDVGCGTGRLMLPLLQAGLEIDGCDVSPDMLALCRDSCRRAGFAPQLYAQAMHGLDVPRKYATIFVCGGFGLGGNHSHDRQALLRFRRSLVPGGTLIVDIHTAYENKECWQLWRSDDRRALPQAWGPPPTGRQAADGSSLSLSSRVVDLDPISQVITREIRAARWRDGQLEASEQYTLKERLYFHDELLMMLEQAGFEDVRVEHDYTSDEVSSDADVLVFIARAS